MKVLLVDDEPGFLEQAEIFLEKEAEELDIDTTDYPEKGLEMLEDHDYDAIVSDYQMPEMDGLEFLKTVREERGSDIPFIIFTGKGREEVAMKALNLGADRYLQKGGSPKSQYEVLARAVVQEVKHSKLFLEKEKVEAEHSSLVKGSEDPIYIVDENCRFTFANQAELEKTGMEFEEIIGSKFGESHPENDAREFEEKVKKALETEEPQRQEIKHEDTGKYYDRTISPFKNPRTGKVDRVSVISKDVTERKKKEEELRRERKRFREIFNNANDAIYLHKLNEEGMPGEFIEVNDVACEMLGYSREELLKMSPQDIDSSEKADKVPEVMEELLDEGDVRFEMVHQAKEGTEIPVEIHSHLFELEGEERVLSVARDITERKEAERELERSEKRFNTLLSNTPAVIYTYEVIDGKPKTTFVSESVKDVLGHEPEYYTSDPENFLNDLHPEDAQELSEKEEKLLTEGDTERITAEYRFKDKQGNYRWLHDEQQLNTYEDGTQEVIGAWWDITERKEAEERKEFLHSLIRHDVRNKSQIVQGYLELVEDYDPPSDVEEYLSKARKATRDGIDIIEKVRTLRDIGRKGEVEEVSIDSIIKNVISERESQAQEKGIEIEYEEIDSKVLGGSLLEELFSNLIENSIQHSGGNKIRISSQEKENECIVIVEDDGGGIPDGDKDKIFERGFKSGDTGGSGLGMYLVKQIIESYNGSIEVKDSEWGGARFDIYLHKA